MLMGAPHDALRASNAGVSTHFKYHGMNVFVAELRKVFRGSSERLHSRALRRAYDRCISAFS